MYSIKVTGPGEALRWIFHYASREEEVSWSDFQVHLTASQIADLRLIMKRTRLVKAFASLFHFGPLWQDLTAGVLATLRKNRCEEVRCPKTLRRAGVLLSTTRKLSIILPESECNSTRLLSAANPPSWSR